MDLKSFEKFFDIHRFEKYFSTDASSRNTLEHLMLSGEKPETWIETSRFLGKFAADLSFSTLFSSLSESNRSNVKDFANSSTICLKKWLDENASTEESILSVLPERYRDHEDAIRLRRASETSRRFLNLHESVGLQSLTSDKILYDSKLDPKIVANKDFVFGPTSLSTAIFLADIFVNYYQMTGKVEHGAQYQVVEMCNEFGKSFDDAANGFHKDYDSKKFWKEVALLTGWEIIRRCHKLERVKLLEENVYGGTSDCVQAGLRLIHNERIEAVGFLTFVGFALC